MKLTLKDYCERNNPALLREWDAEKNDSLTPEQVSYGSQRKVWWRCAKGHSWQTYVCARTAKKPRGCPVCAGQTILSGYNDLASCCPELAKEWDFEKNGSLTPQAVSTSSPRNVWWRCAEGHTWKARISSRVRRDSGCPVCALQSNNLAKKHPDLAKEWHPVLNGDKSPEDYMAGSAKKAWWLCEKGHAWQAKIVQRVLLGTGCPFCRGHAVLPGYNDLGTLHPELAAQWYQPLNGDVTPQDVRAGSGYRAWWRCGEGHIWQAVVAIRTYSHTGCPVCARCDSGWKQEKYRRIIVERKERT